MKRRQLLHASAATAVLLPVATTSSGCATLLGLIGDFIKAPDVAIKSMKVKQASLTRITANFVASISNPNAFGFRLEGLDWGIKLAGAEMAKGRSPKGIQLKARGRSTTDLDVTFDVGKTAEAILELLRSSTIPYEISTVSRFKAREYDVDVPADFKGNMPMPKVPPLNVTSFDVTSASASGIGFRMQTSVTNPNPFAIPIDGFNFDVKLGGRSVLSNKPLRGLTLEPKKSEKVALDFRVGLAQAGLSLAQLTRSPRLDWEVNADLRSGILALPFTDRGSVRIG